VPLQSISSLNNRGDMVGSGFTDDAFDNFLLKHIGPEAPAELAAPVHGRSAAQRDVRRLFEVRRKTRDRLLGVERIPAAAD
jgi:hypothetical protein